MQILRGSVRLAPSTALAALPESVQIKVPFVSKKVESECEKAEQSRKPAWRGTVKDC